MLKSVTFEVVGVQRLACEGCEERVENALKTLPGVEQVRARARNQRIEVLFDTTMLDPTTIGEHLGKAGYQTKVSSPTN